MKDLNKQPFEEEWRRAFEEAEASPSGDVWTRLDAHLANEETKKYKHKLLWFQRIAAGIILLLLGGSAWLWLNNAPQVSEKVTQSASTSASETTSSETTRGSSEISSTNGTATQAENGMSLRSEENSNRPAGQREEQPIQSEHNPLDLATTQTPKSDALANKPGASRLQNKRVSPSGQQRNTPDQNVTPGRLATVARQQKAIVRNSAPKNGPVVSYYEQVTAPKQSFNVIPADNTPTESNGDRWAFYELSPRRIAAKEPVIRPRSILPHLSEAYWSKVLAEEERKESKKLDHWQVGVAFAPSTFQPNFRLNESSPAFVNKVNTLASGFSSARTDMSSLSVANRDLENAVAAGLSYQTGLRVEYMLSQRLSLQSGVDYLYNSSSIPTNSYVRNFYNGKREPAFASILNYSNQIRTETMVFSDAQASLSNNSSDYGYKDLTQSSSEIPIRNIYEYIGVPLKVNYLVLDKKLGATVGAGISGDVFLNNRFGSEEAEIDEVNIPSTKGTVYRTLGISAWLGVKMQYRFANQYSVFLEPSYRTAITSFTNTNALQSHPSLFGVGMGLQMRF